MKMVFKVGLTVSSVAVIVFAYVVYQHVWPVYSDIVRLKDGDVQGIVSVSRGGKEFYEYLAIPYAKKPIGNLRFEVILKFLLGYL